MRFNCVDQDKMHVVGPSLREAVGIVAEALENDSGERAKFDKDRLVLEKLVQRVGSALPVAQREIARNLPSLQRDIGISAAVVVGATDVHAIGGRERAIWKAVTVGLRGKGCQSGARQHVLGKNGRTSWIFFFTPSTRAAK